MTSIVATPTGAEATVSLAGDARGAAQRAGPGPVAVAGGGAVPRLPARPTATPPYLDDGDRVAADRHRHPGQPVAPRSSRSARSSTRSTPSKLRRLLVALSTGLGGTGDDLGQLLDQGQLCSPTSTAPGRRPNGCSATPGRSSTSRSPRPATCAPWPARRASWPRSSATTTPSCAPPCGVPRTSSSSSASLVRDVADVLPPFLRHGAAVHRRVRRPRPAPAGAAAVLRPGPRHPHRRDPQRRAPPRADPRQGRPLRLRHRPPRPPRPGPPPAPGQRPLLRRRSRSSSAAPRTRPDRSRCRSSEARP